LLSQLYEYPTDPAGAVPGMVPYIYLVLYQVLW
jgi:hypothetical protein